MSRIVRCGHCQQPMRILYGRVGVHAACAEEARKLDEDRKQKRGFIVTPLIRDEDGRKS